MVKIVDEKQIVQAQEIIESYASWFRRFATIKDHIPMGHVVHVLMLHNFKSFTKLLEFKQMNEPKERFEFRKARNKFIIGYLLTHPNATPDKLLDQEFNELSNDVVYLSETHIIGQKEYSLKKFIAEKKKKQGVSFHD